MGMGGISGGGRHRRRLARTLLTFITTPLPRKCPAAHLAAPSCNADLCASYLRSIAHLQSVQGTPGSWLQEAAGVRKAPGERGVGEGGCLNFRRAQAGAYRLRRHMGDTACMMDAFPCRGASACDRAGFEAAWQAAGASHAASPQNQPAHLLAEARTPWFR